MPLADPVFAPRISTNAARRLIASGRCDARPARVLTSLYTFLYIPSGRRTHSCLLTASYASKPLLMCIRTRRNSRARRAAADIKMSWPRHAARDVFGAMRSEPCVRSRAFGALRSEPCPCRLDILLRSLSFSSGCIQRTTSDSTAAASACYHLRDSFGGDRYRVRAGALKLNVNGYLRPPQLSIRETRIVSDPVLVRCKHSHMHSPRFIHRRCVAREHGVTRNWPRKAAKGSRLHRHSAALPQRYTATALHCHSYTATLPQRYTATATATTAS